MNADETTRKKLLPPDAVKWQWEWLVGWDGLGWDGMGWELPQELESCLWEQGLTPGGLCASPRANPPPWGAVPLSGPSSSSDELGAGCWAASCSGITQPG